MKKKFYFNFRYFVLFVLLFVTEILIAIYVHDQIIRPYIGDLLVVILIYTFLKSFLKTPVTETAVAVLLFAYAVETSQYFNLIGTLGLEHSTAAKLIMGNSFGWMDIIAYTAGIAVVFGFEKIRSKKNLEISN